MQIRPNPGKQEQFLASRADIAIFGGAAGGGKSWALLLETLRHVTANERFAAVYFRRNTTQIKNPGGLWDQSMRVYPYTGGVPNHTLEWRWPQGGRVKLAHLEHETTKLDWHGAEIPLICFDELTTFTESQFWYLFSRNRSMSNVRGYIRATCNPDADSWVAKLIEWWIDQKTGFPIPERCGVLRWFVRIDDHLVWADSATELTMRYANSVPKSITFISALLADNPALDKGDPGYRGNLMAMQRVDRERLLSGNWKIRPSAGLYFSRAWCQPIIDIAPIAGMRWVRGWDLAATPYNGVNDPDWTCSVKIGRAPDGIYYIVNATWMRGSPRQVRNFVKATAALDGKLVKIQIPQDPGQSGKDQAADYVGELDGYDVRCMVESGKGDKIERFSPFSAQAEAGHVRLVKGDWNERFINELEAFPEMTHDDMPDACSTAHRALTAFVVVIGGAFIGESSREQEGWSVPG